VSKKGVTGGTYAGTTKKRESQWRANRMVDLKTKRIYLRNGGAGDADQREKTRSFLEKSLRPRGGKRGLSSLERKKKRKRQRKRGKLLHALVRE